MSTYLEKSSSFDLPCVSFVNVFLICVYASFPFDVGLDCISS